MHKIQKTRRAYTVCFQGWGQMRERSLPNWRGNPLGAFMGTIKYVIPNSDQDRLYDLLPRKGHAFIR